MPKLFKDAGFTLTDKVFFAVVLRTSGAVEVKQFNAPELPLKWLQEQVDGYIEIVRGAILPGDAYMIVNEDGLSMELPLNRLASWLYSVGNVGIVGDVVVCCDFDFDTLIYEPDAYAAPLFWINSLLRKLGLYDVAVFVQ